MVLRCLKLSLSSKLTFVSMYLCLLELAVYKQIEIIHGQIKVLHSHIYFQSLYCFKYI